MNTYIPTAFFSKDIIQTFRKQFPKSAFVLSNSGPVHAGFKSSMAYQSENLQIIRVEKSNMIPNSKQFQMRCLKCYQKVKQHQQKLSNTQKVNILAQNFSQEFLGINICVLLSQSPFAWSAVEENKYYEIKENGQQILVIFA